MSREVDVVTPGEPVPILYSAAVPGACATSGERLRIKYNTTHTKQAGHKLASSLARQPAKDNEKEVLEEGSERLRPPRPEYLNMAEREADEDRSFNVENPMGESKKNRGGDVEMASSAAKGKQAAGANGHDSTAENKVDDEEDSEIEEVGSYPNSIFMLVVASAYKAPKGWQTATWLFAGLAIVFVQITCLIGVIFSQSSFRSCTQESDCQVGQVCVTSPRLSGTGYCADCKYTRYESGSLLVDDDGLTPTEYCANQLEKYPAKALRLGNFDRCIYVAVHQANSNPYDAIVRWFVFFLVSGAVALERSQQTVTAQLRVNIGTLKKGTTSKVEIGCLLLIDFLLDKVMLSCVPFSMLIRLARNGFSSGTCLLNGISTVFVLGIDDLCAALWLDYKTEGAFAKEVQAYISSRSRAIRDFHLRCNRRGFIRGALTFLYLVVDFEAVILRTDCINNLAYSWYFASLLTFVATFLDELLAPFPEANCRGTNYRVPIIIGEATLAGGTYCAIMYLSFRLYMLMVMR